MDIHIRQKRVRAINLWAQDGIGKQREKFEIESLFAERVESLAEPFFKPLTIPENANNRDYHVEISHMVDALDMLPNNLDRAFDSMWKALESMCRRFDASARTNITETLATIEEHLATRPFIVDALSANIPLQAADFLLARTFAGREGQVKDERARKRILKDDLLHAGLAECLKALEAKYDYTDPTQRHKGSRLFLKILRGDEVEMSGALYKLSFAHRSRLITSGILYTFRNYRFHGSTPSPFTSSAASLETFSLPGYAFISTYYIYLVLLRDKGELEATDEEIQRSISSNCHQIAQALGKGWGALGNG